MLKRLGRSSALLSKLREALLSLTRLIAFFRAEAESWMEDGTKAKLRVLDRDLRSLADYQAQVSS